MATRDSFGRPQRDTTLSPRALAMRSLARRPLTRAELHGRLVDKGIDDAAAAAVVQQLIDERLINDAELAYDFIVVRARRMRHGPTRLIQDLERRGVAESVATAAWERAVAQGDLDPHELLRDAVARRLKREHDDTAAVRRRVYNALLRAGFPGTGLHAELVRQLARINASEHGNDYESP